MAFWLVMEWVIAMLPAAAVAAPTYQGSWNRACSPDTAMLVADVAVSNSGSIFVLSAHKRAHKFNDSGECLFNWTVNAASTQLFTIDATSDGGAIVLDFAARKVRIFASDGSSIAVWGTFGNGLGQLNEPYGAILNPEGEVVIPDAGKMRVMVFTMDGTYLREWTPNVLPQIAAVDDSGYVYLAGSAGVMSMFRGDGSFVRYIGTQSDHPNPTGIAVAPDGSIYVSDWSRGNISVFDRSGIRIDRFGTPGTGPGQFAGIGALAFDALGNLYVCEQQRISKWGPGPSPSTRRSWGQLKVMHR
jgi:DNA-binding beta-propeller fold protein YncE